ncbi:MAG: hypothetical protein HQL72_08290 [Magnetococcales bacterium]|nr:hypothetical protein [Magnetococcales bacterium]
MAQNIGLAVIMEKIEATQWVMRHFFYGVSHSYPPSRIGLILPYTQKEKVQACLENPTCQSVKSKAKGLEAWALPRPIRNNLPPNLVWNRYFFIPITTRSR